MRRPLAAFLAVIALPVIVAACASEFKPDDSDPKSAVRTFLGHLARGDGDAAYAMLSARAQENCTEQFFLDQLTYIQQELDNSRVIVRDTNIRDGRATVLAAVDPGRVDVGVLGPRPNSFETTYTLVLEGGGWRVNDQGWPYGYCDFRKPPPEAVPATPTTPGGGESTPAATPAARP